MASLAGFDFSQVPEQQDFSALPEGYYTVMAISSEIKATKSGTGQYLQVAFEVLDGQHKGRKLWSRMNLVNPSEIAVGIAKRELLAISRAVGYNLPPDISEELHNKPLVVRVAVEIDDRRRESNSIKEYLKVGEREIAPAPAGQPAFQQPAPPAMAQQPAAAAVGGASPPWRK